MEEGGARLREAPRLALPLRGTLRGETTQTAQVTLKIGFHSRSFGSRFDRRPHADAQHGEAAAEAARKAGGSHVPGVSWEPLAMRDAT